MRTRLLACISIVTMLAAACGPADTAGPEAEAAIPGGPIEIISAVNAYCDVATVAEIEADVNALFTGAGWPDANSVLGKFAEIRNLLAAGNSLGAKRKTFDLARFILKKFEKLPAAQKAAVDDQTKALVADLYCFVGLSGAVFDLKPNDPAKAFVSEVGPNGENGGVWFPPNVVQEGTLITITVIPDGSPLITPLDKYPTYLEVEKYPDLPLNLANGKPVVGVCFPATTPLLVAQRLLLGHQRIDGLGADQGFELLPNQTIPAALAALLSCPSITSQGPEAVPTSWLGRAVARLADAVLPPTLQAAPLFAFGGVGGSPEEFSPFGAVDPYLSAFGGAGGAPEEFSPGLPGLMLGAGTAGDPITGAVGSQATTGLPTVTVRTHLGTPIPGVLVTFSVAPASATTPAGAASLCAGYDYSIVTNAAGQAVMPCLNFGSTAGYSNIKAEFDPSALNFPGADLVTVNGNGVAGKDLNFLAQTLGPITVFGFGSGGYSYFPNAGATPPSGWTTATAAAGWVSAATAPFGGSYTGCAITNPFPSAGTAWPVSTNILVRKDFSTPYTGTLTIEAYIDNDIEIYLDGVNVTAQAVARSGPADNAGNWSLYAGNLRGRHENCADNGNPVITLTNVSAGLHQLAIFAIGRGTVEYLDVKVDLAPSAPLD